MKYSKEMEAKLRQIETAFPYDENCREEANEVYAKAFKKGEISSIEYDYYRLLCEQEKARNSYWR